MLTASLVAAVLSITATNSLWANDSAQPSQQMAEFLNFEPESQAGYLQNAVVMIATIAAQTQPTMVDCINDWYLESDAKAEQRNAEFLSTMQKYKEFTPNTVVLAVVEQACGKFKRSE